MACPNCTASVKKSGEAAIDFGVAKISATLRSSPDARSRLRQYLEPQTDNLITLINQELLEPANKDLQAQGKQGLVVIVDSLDGSVLVTDVVGECNTVSLGLNTKVNHLLTQQSEKCECEHEVFPSTKI